MGKHYRKVNKKEDYTKSKYQPCWTCKRACGGCSWSAFGVPVDGWKAEKKLIPENGTHAETYKINYCPYYERG